jgi:hypothetical protein
MARRTPLPLVNRAAETLALPLGEATGPAGVSTEPAGVPTALRKYEQPVTATAAKRIRDRII